MSAPSAMDLPSPSQHQYNAPIDEDPAASLRAAALKTLKAKRRKGPDGSDLPASLPLRPLVTTSSIQLDYGTEDLPGTSATAPAASPAPTSAISTKPPPPPAPVPMDVDEDQTREEGEISDSESMPPPKSPQVSRQTPRPLSRSIPVKSSTKDRPIPPPISSMSLSASSVNVKVEPSPQHLPDSLPSATQSTSGASHYSSMVDCEMYAVDDEHVRPGLASQS